MSVYVQNGVVVNIKKETKTTNVKQVEVKKLDGTVLKLKTADVEKIVHELEKRTMEADHVVVTKFRNDDSQPTLFATAKGEFISVANKEEFKEADKKGGLKLTVDEAKAIISAKDFDDKDIEVSPAFTAAQFIEQA